MEHRSLMSYLIFQLVMFYSCATKYKETISISTWWILTNPSSPCRYPQLFPCRQWSSHFCWMNYGLMAERYKELQSSWASCTSPYSGWGPTHLKMIFFTWFIWNHRPVPTRTNEISEFRDPKLEVPTICKAYEAYKAYVMEYPSKIWPYMVQCLHFRILKFPLTYPGM